jgi:hypothetical protein
MPPLPGHELGEPPPPVPRKLPNGFAFRTRWTSNIATLVGGGFLAVGLLFLIAFIKAKTWAVVIPIFFMTGGFFVFLHGWRHASSVLRAFRKGVAVRGEVFECKVDRTQSMNGEHPFKLTWHFAVGNRQFEGTLTSFDSTLGSRARGQPVWVLYVADDPEQNTLYPPVK